MATRFLLSALWMLAVGVAPAQGQAPPLRPPPPRPKIPVLAPGSGRHQRLSSDTLGQVSFYSDLPVGADGRRLWTYSGVFALSRDTINHIVGSLSDSSSASPLHILYRLPGNAPLAGIHGAS